LLQGCASESTAQQGDQGGTSKTYPDSATAAAQAIATLRQLVTPENYQELGFESVDEAAAAQLGQPLHVLLVRLDQLREYNPQSDPSALLTDGQQDYYPVEAREQTRASIIVEQVKEGWRAASFGNAGLAKHLDTVQRGVAAKNAGKSVEMALVEVPALGIYFLGHRRGQREWQLTPLADQPRLKFKAGATLPAREALAALVPAAKSYNGLPM
jgi:hypothetical protein